MIVKITFSLFIHKSIALVSSRLIALAISSAVAAGAINKCPAEVFEWVSFYQKGPALAWPGRARSPEVRSLANVRSEVAS